MAAPANEISRTLRDALFETLNAILSPVHDVRTSAEQQINVLEVTDDFPVHLTELMLDGNAPFAIRQLASVLLKQYVESHWSSYSEKFRPPETTPEAKARVRAMLPMGLHESISKLRSSIAYAVSTIANWDWPESWPELFDILVQSLISENSCAVHGAMRVLKEISCDVSEDQMPKFAPVILPEMLKVFVQDQKYSIRTRGRAVEIFINLADTIASMSMFKPSAKSLLHPITTPFTEALVSALKTPDGMASDSGLKRDILSALVVLIKYFPECINQWIAHILTPVWNSLTESANIYVRTMVNDNEEVNNPIDSDGVVLGYENLIYSLFEFVSALIHSNELKHHVEKGMKDLLHYLLLYMQITENQIKTWNANPDVFVEDEDDDTYAYSVRISAQDLLVSLSEEFPDKTSICLCEAVVGHIDKVDKVHNIHWWKIHEACMFALGGMKADIISLMQENNLQFDIIGFLQSVAVEDLNTSVSPFLTGRCLVFASKYVHVMNDGLINRFLEATINGLQNTQPLGVCLSAIRAICGFCDNLKSSGRAHLLHPYLTPITDRLVTLAIQHSSDVLGLVLEALGNVITIDGNFTAQYENKISPIAIAVFLRHHSDPVLVSLAQELIKELCRNPSCTGPIQQRLIPTIVSILQAQTTKVPLGLQAVSLDILEIIVRHSTLPLSEVIITQAFPIALQCVMNSDDSSILQNGGECLRAFVSVALDQITSWQDESGHNGLDYIINVIQRLLDPKTPEGASAFVGRLISLIIIKASSALGDRSELLLRGVLSKMQQAEALTVVENLILVFASLISHQIEPVLEFLSGVPGPTGQSALQFVMNKWCEGHVFFFGNYEKKVSTVSLSKVLQFSLQGNDHGLQNMKVKGDQIFNDNEAPVTRSKSQQNPFQWTQIPLLVKIFKILLNELSNVCEQDENGDDDSYEDIEDDDEDNFGDSITAKAAAITNIMSSEYMSSELEKDDYDADVLADPVYSINLKSYLTEFLQHLVQHPCFNTISAYLSPHEKKLLHSLEIVSA